jgi:hypothetical protein
VHAGAPAAASLAGEAPPPPEGDAERATVEKLAAAVAQQGEGPCSVLCCAVLCCAVLCCTVPCCAVLCCGLVLRWAKSRFMLQVWAFASCLVSTSCTLRTIIAITICISRIVC